MRIFAEPLWLPKAGNADAEYEDAFCPRHPIVGEIHSRFAVADGATETSFSGIWARQLVRAYCSGTFDNLTDTMSIRAMQSKWWKIVRKKPLAWYAEEKLESGAFAALLGLTISAESATSERGIWQATAVGDSCLVQMRGSTVFTTFPLTSSEAFTNSPVLLSTKDSDEAGLRSLASISGDWQCGDHFYLMTDAIAAWFFRAIEQQEAPWTIIRDLDNDPNKPFREWIEQARKQSLMRNDDVTLYRIEIT